MRFAVLCLSAVTLAAAGKPAPAQAANDKVAISAMLLLGKDAIRQELGNDLDGNFILVRVQVTPKDRAPLTVSPDDFLLRSYKDGQKSGAFAPSQIAGQAAMVISSRGGSGGLMTRETGPVWGGYPGTGEPPHRLPGSAVNMGTGASSPDQANAEVRTNAKQKEDPLLNVLKQRILPARETSEPVSGLLYFSLEGKHKPKQLALDYNGPAGKLRLQFR